MAPEIQSRKEDYNGHSADIFAAGVILFILVQGIFPFTDASIKCQLYKLIVRQDYAKYWYLNDETNPSDDLKSLVVQMFSHDP